MALDSGFTLLFQHISLWKINTMTSPILYYHCVCKPFSSIGTECLYFFNMSLKSTNDAFRFTHYRLESMHVQWWMKTYSVLLVLLSFLGVSFRLLLRFLPGFFVVFEFLYSRVTAVGSIWREAITRINRTNLEPWKLKTISIWALCTFVKLHCASWNLWVYAGSEGLYQLVFVFCSSPPSSFDLWKLDSAFQSTSSHLDCSTKQTCQSDKRSYDTQAQIWFSCLDGCDKR